MRQNRVLVSFIVLILLIVPVASHAQSTGNLQSNIIALLQQIITLQKQLIETLQNQITQLSLQITNLQKQLPSVSSQINTPHICSIVNPPACSTTLAVTRDSYNCVTGYVCAPQQTTTTSAPTVYGASCTGYGLTSAADGQTSYGSWCPPPPSGGACSAPQNWLCKNGQWVSASAAANSCTFANTPIGSACGGYRHCFVSVGVAGGPGDYWMPLNSPVQPANCYQIAP